MKRSPAGDAALLAAATLVGMLLVHDARLSTVDDLDRYHLVEGIVRYGKFVEPPWHGVPGLGGERVSRYGPLPPLVAVPFYLAATPLAPPWEGWDRRTPFAATGAAVDLVNAFVLAALVAEMYLLGRALGADRRAAAVVAGALPWTTFLGAQAKDFGAEPLAALLAVASLHAARRARRKPRGGLGASFAAGLAAGLAPLARPETSILIPGPFWVALGRTPGATRRAAAFLAGAAPGLAAAALYTLWRFGRFASGYAAHGQGFDAGAIPHGAVGLLLSPGRSVFLYAPTIVFLLWWLRRRWPDLPSAAWAAVWMGAADLALHFAWPAWEGGYVWGPRYAFLLVVLLHVAAPLGLDGPLRRRAYAALAALGLAVNLPGLLADAAAYLEILRAAHPPWGEALAWWSPLHHPWFGHVMLLVHGRHDLWILRAIGL